MALLSLLGGDVMSMRRFGGHAEIVANIAAYGDLQILMRSVHCNACVRYLV